MMSLSVCLSLYCTESMFNILVFLKKTRKRLFNVLFPSVFVCFIVLTVEH